MGEAPDRSTIYNMFRSHHPSSCPRVENEMRTAIHTALGTFSKDLVGVRLVNDLGHAVAMADDHEVAALLQLAQRRCNAFHANCVKAGLAPIRSLKCLAAGRAENAPLRMEGSPRLIPADGDVVHDLVTAAVGTHTGLHPRSPVTTNLS